MDDSQVLRILIIGNSDETVARVGAILQRYEGARFEISHVPTAAEGIAKATGGDPFDLILMDYFLPDRNGMDATRLMKEKKVEIPIAFLTDNKDVSVVVEVMRIGVADYFLTDDLAPHLFPQAILGVVEKHKLRKEFAALEVRKRRLEAMQELVFDISGQITEPVTEMKKVVEEFLTLESAAKNMRLLSLIRENVMRMDRTLEKLKNLKDDKTVQYIKDIRMIDLS